MKPSIAIHRLIRRTQQRNRRVGRSVETGLSLVESHLLIELAAETDQSLGELTSKLMLAQGFTSRVVQALAKRKLVSIKAGDSDKRRRKLALTASGRAAVSKTDSIADASYRAMIEHVAPADQQRVEWLFKSIADGMGGLSSVRRATEPSYRVEQRRLTRVCGLLSESVFGTELSNTMWQVLAEVVLAPIPPQPGELAELLSLASNSLSSIVSEMEAKGYLKRTPYRADRRSVVLRPLPRGERLYRDVEAVAARRIEDALRDQSLQRVEEAVDAFKRFVDDGAQGLPVLPAQLRVVRAESEEQRKAARGFIARSLVREKAEQEIPDSFVSGRHECFVLLGGDVMMAALDGDAATGVISSCGWFESVSPWSLAAFISTALLSSGRDRSALTRSVASFPPLRDFMNV